jgi:hypothetical protein
MTIYWLGGKGRPGSASSWTSAPASRPARTPGRRRSSWPTPDFNPEETAKAVAAAEAAGVTLVPRTQAEVGEFFTGLELVDPGVTPVLSWRPDAPPADPRVAYWAGIARKL